MVYHCLVSTLLKKVIMSKIPVHMFVSVSYMKQGGFKTEKISVPAMGRIFYSEYQNAPLAYLQITRFPIARDDCRQQVFRIPDV